jgi:hypothetical protein
MTWDHIKPVGARLARDKDSAHIRYIASSLIASKLCSHWWLTYAAPITLGVANLTSRRASTR